MSFDPLHLAHARVFAMTQCIACSGTGVGHGTGIVPRGVPLPLCDRCEGAGVLEDEAPSFTKPFRAIWLVGARYIVRMAVPRKKGVVELDIEWDPRVPPEKGPGKLKPQDRKEYEQGRDTALRVLNRELGGDWSIVKERH